MTMADMVAGKKYRLIEDGIFTFEVDCLGKPTAEEIIDHCGCHPGQGHYIKIVYDTGQEDILFEATEWLGRMLQVELV